MEDFVHLCQPDAGKSCGACCGLYNYTANSRESLVARLRRRTRLFRETVKGPDNLAEFSQMVRDTEDQTRIYEVIYCCEYIGFLDPGEQKVGCLLHPMQNKGADFRDVSFYGRELCDGHFCPSYHYISRDEKLALINIIDDWYLFGLCITDIDLVKEYFRFVSEGVYEMPHPARFGEEPLKSIALDFFKLKINWPFRSPADNRFGKYAFDGRHYMIPYIDYAAIGCEKSRFDKIFLSLSSEFRDAGALSAAEVLISKHIDRFVTAYLDNSAT
jgi:hypothetical protein